MRWAVSFMAVVSGLQSRSKLTKCIIHLLWFHLKSISYAPCISIYVYSYFQRKGTNFSLFRINEYRHVHFLYDSKVRRLYSYEKKVYGRFTPPLVSVVTVQLASFNFLLYKWTTERCTNLFTFQNLVDDRPQQLSRSKYLMNSASSAAEMTLNRLNFASKLTPSYLHPSPQSVTLGHPAPTQRDTSAASKMLENVQLWEIVLI